MRRHSLKVQARVTLMTGLAVPISSLLMFTSACNGPHAQVPATSSSATPGAVLATPSPASAVALPQPSASSVAPVAVMAGPHTWSFDDVAADVPPPGFSFGRTGRGKAGRWNVHADSGAPSGAHVLAQLDPDDTDCRFPIAVADTPLVKDGVVSVRCKPVSGRVDQACGLVFRYRDADNYYVTRANALENNVRLYHVAKGNRQQFAGWNGAVISGHWHSLQATAKGDHFVVLWDDKKVIDAHDATFSEPGKVGVWTKADSVTYFDDLRVEPKP